MQAHLDLKQPTQPELGIDSERLRLEVETSVPDLLHVKITDARRRRWEVPHALLHTSAEHIKGTPSHAAAAQGKPPCVHARAQRPQSKLPGRRVCQSCCLSSGDGWKHSQSTCRACRALGT